MSCLLEIHQDDRLAERRRDRLWERGLSHTEMDERRDQVRRAEWSRCLVAYHSKVTGGERARSILTLAKQPMVIFKNTPPADRESTLVDEQTLLL